MKKTSEKLQSTDGVYVNVDELLGLRFFARNIQLSETRSSSSIIDGESKSRYRGRGMEFSEVRPYFPGDDIRNIDWRVTARTQKTYTKLFQEEKERPVYIVVDQRSNMFFGSKGQFKSVLATKLASLIGWAALNNNDRIGAMIFSDTDEIELRAKRGKHAQLNLIHQLVSFNNALNQPFPKNNLHQESEQISNKTIKSLTEICKELSHIAKPGSAIFIISDFYDFSHDCREPLSMLSRHTDVHLLKIFDQLEQHLPLKTNLAVSNGQDQIQLSELGKKSIEEYYYLFKKQVEEITHYTSNRGIVFSSLDTAHTLDEHLEQLFALNRSTKHYKK